MVVEFLYVHTRRDTTGKSAVGCVLVCLDGSELVCFIGYANGCLVARLVIVVDCVIGCLIV